MTCELTKYRAQLTRMVSLSVEKKLSMSNDNAELKSTVKSLRVKVGAKKKEANVDLEGRIQEQKQPAQGVRGPNRLVSGEKVGGGHK